MFRREKPATPQVDAAVGKGVNYEITIADIARRSEKRAWIVAFTAIVMSLILAGGYFYMLPLKEKVPFLVMADAYTGTATVATLRGDFSQNSITASEAINRSNVWQFVTARESYDLAVMQMRDWNTVYVMSAPNVSQEYRALHARNNERAPFYTYGANRAIRVRILSLQLVGGGQGTPPTGATVRFQRSVYDKTTGGTAPLDSRIATLAFTYKPNLKLSEEQRVLNPLGFQVTEYRVDADYATAPPAEVAIAPPAAPVPIASPPDAALPAGAVPGSTPLDPNAMPATPTVDAAGLPPAPGAQPANAAPAATPPAAVQPAQVAPNTTNGVRR